MSLGGTEKGCPLELFFLSFLVLGILGVWEKIFFDGGE